MFDPSRFVPSTMCIIGSDCFGQFHFRQKGSDKNHTSLVLADLVCFMVDLVCFMVLSSLLTKFVLKQDYLTIFPMHWCLFAVF